MKASVTKSANKCVFSKIFFDYYQIIEVAEIIHNDFMDYELSVLGRTSKLFSAQGKDTIDNGKTIQNHVGELTALGSEFRTFFNPEIGNIFIIGPLSSIFLNDLEGKSLGALSMGPYGILRGLGISQEIAKAHLSALKKGGYLMIVRGFDDQLKDLKNLLEPEMVNRIGLQ